jgi:hypothetical protein
MDNMNIGRGNQSAASATTEDQEKFVKAKRQKIEHPGGRAGAIEMEVEEEKARVKKARVAVDKAQAAVAWWEARIAALRQQLALASTFPPYSGTMDLSNMLEQVAKAIENMSEDEKNNQLNGWLNEAVMEEAKATAERDKATNWLKDANNVLIAREAALEKATIGSASSTQASVSAVQISFDQLMGIMMEAPFVLKCDEFDPAKQKELLGSLNNENYQLPIVRDQIDMRFFPGFNHLTAASTSSSASVDGASSSNVRCLRPAAQALSGQIQSGFHLPTCYYFVAVSGSGKTSAMFDLAYKHYEIYIQCADKEDFDTSGVAMFKKRWSREPDAAFVDFVSDVFLFIDTKPGADKRSNWDIVHNRAAIELLARLMILPRLHEVLKAQIPPVEVTPWHFLIQQLHSHEFIKHVVLELMGLKFFQVEYLIAKLILYLRRNNIIAGSYGNGNSTSNSQLIVAIDEIESGIAFYKGHFQKHPEKPSSVYGLISPFLQAIADLQTAAQWDIVLAGTGSSHERINTIKTNVGKTSDGKIHIFSQLDFPMTSLEDCQYIFSHLNLGPNELTSQGIPDVSDPLPGEEINLNISELIRFYLVNSRFRLLFGAIERIPSFLRENARERPIEILKKAILKSINDHRTRILELINERMDPKEVESQAVIERRLEYLTQIYFGTKLTNGKITFPHEINENNAVLDLTTLGVAGAIIDTGESASEIVSYRVTERVALEAIEKLFLGGRIPDKRFSGLLEDLHSVLASYPKTTMHGNILEKIFLHKLIDTSHKKVMVSDLPIMSVAKTFQDTKEGGIATRGVVAGTTIPPKTLQPATKAEFKPWTNILFVAKMIWDGSNIEMSTTSSTSSSTQDNLKEINFLSSEASVGKFLMPEIICRPDGILMLQPKDGFRFAIFLGSKVYSDTVPTKKAISQFRSTDPSRCYLQKDSDTIINDERREAWTNANLHLTRAVRINITLPKTTHNAYEGCYEFAGCLGKLVKEKIKVNEKFVVKEEFEMCEKEQDLIVNLDMTNIHLLIGENKDQNEPLYRLMAVATKTDVKEWCKESSKESRKESSKVSKKRGR